MKPFVNYALATFVGTAALLVGMVGTSGAQDKIPIGFSQGTMESSWRVNMVEGNRKYAESNLPDVDLIITNGENTASKRKFAGSCQSCGREDQFFVDKESCHFYLPGMPRPALLPNSGAVIRAKPRNFVSAASSRRERQRR